MKREYIILGCLLSVGLLLRVFAIDFGFHIDEPNIVNRAIAISQGDVHQSWYNWPAQSLMFLYAGLFWMADHLSSVPAYYIIARAVSVVFGVASIVMVYVIGKTITRSAAAGLWSALFVATSQLLIRHSHYATPDAALTLFGLVMVYCTIQAYSETTAKKIQRWYIWAGLVLGIALATKYTAAVFAVPMIIVWISKYRRQWKIIAWFVAAAFIAHTITNPFALFDLDLIWKQLLIEADPNRLGQDWSGKNHFIYNLIYYISSTPEWIGSLISILAVGGGFGSIIYAIRQRQWIYLCIPGFWILYVLSISSLGLHWSRWSLPMLPMIAILAGLASWWVIKKISRPYLRIAISIVTALLFTMPQIVSSIVFGYSDLQPSTSDRVAHWLSFRRDEAILVVGDVEDITLKKPDTYEARTNRLHEFTYDQYKEQGVDFIVVRKKDVEYRRAEPQKYANELVFFDELELRSKKVHVETKPQKTILQSKHDWDVYRWLLNSKKRAMTFNVYQGEPLIVYRLD